MEIEKSQSSYALIKADLDYNLLHDIFDNFKNQLVELDLSKKFKQNNYSYSSNTNPLWKTLKIYDHWYLEKILTLFGLADMETVVSLSNLPNGSELGEHRDIGRKTVLLIPINGVTAPININNSLIYYKDLTLLLDATIMHSVPKTTQDRITLQFSFRQPYNKILSIVNEHIRTTK